MRLEQDTPTIITAILIMKKSISFYLSAFIVVCCLFNATASQAKTRYITDSFEVMMRTGPSVKNKIVKALKSGAQLETLKADAGNGYSQVQTEKGDIGYVLTRYLSTDESAKNRVVYLEDLLTKLKSKPKEIQSLLAKSQEQNEAFLSEKNSLTSKLENTSSELKRIKEISSDAVKLANRNVRLEGEVQQLLLQLDDVRIQNETLKDNADYVRNLTMVGILLLGLFLGWILSRQGNKQRRNSWGS